MALRSSACMLAVLFVSFSVASGQSPCTHTRPRYVEFLADPLDCRGYYVCHNRLSSRQFCEYPNTVWQPVFKVCVRRGSDMDTCTRGGHITTTPVYPPIDQGPCRPGMTTKIAHPTNCARYFDCTQPEKVRELQYPFERECPYPFYYNNVTYRCDGHFNVNCGSRAMHLDPCDYGLNRCTRASCVPCKMRFPSCANLPDGENVFRGKENTPSFVVCRDQRLRQIRSCPIVNSVQYIFSPALRRCVRP